MGMGNNKGGGRTAGVGESGRTTRKGILFINV